MKANTKRVSLIAVILTVALMFSLFSISVFAETDAIDATETVADSTAETTVETSGETSKETSATTTTGTTAGTTASSTTGTSGDGDDLLGTIVSLSILGVIIIAVAAFCIIKKEKVGKFFRSLKSETKKVVWLPWNQVRKNTIVVIIVVVIVALVIGLLDYAFSQGIINLGRLF